MNFEIKKQGIFTVVNERDNTIAENQKIITENNNPDLLQASNDLYTVNADEIIRQQARARADAEFWERNKNAKIKRLEDTIVERDNTIAENQKIITENKKMLAEKDAELLRLQKELAKFKANQSSIT